MGTYHFGLHIPKVHTELSFSWLPFENCLQRSEHFLNLKSGGYILTVKCILFSIFVAKVVNLQCKEKPVRKFLPYKHVVRRKYGNIIVLIPLIAFILFFHLGPRKDKNGRWLLNSLASLWYIVAWVWYVVCKTGIVIVPSKYLEMHREMNAENLATHIFCSISHIPGRLEKQNYWQLSDSIESMFVSL